MKFIEKLAKKQNNLYGAASATIAFLGDSVTQGCFEIYESGKATQGGSQIRKRIWYSPPWFLFWRLNTAIFAS